MSELVHIMFDWDDTLYPSTWINLINKNVLRVETVKMSIILANIEEIILDIFMKYKDQITIITNSDRGWVSISASYYYPRVAHYLQKNSIKIIYAKDCYKKAGSSRAKWKANAMIDIIKSQNIKFKKPSHCIIGFGDQPHDRSAIFLTQENIKIFAKSIKFLEKPTAEELHHELKLVSETIDDIMHYPEHLDLMLTVEHLS